jgi:hypothetical protein
MESITVAYFDRQAVPRSQLGVGTLGVLSWCDDRQIAPGPHCQYSFPCFTCTCTLMHTAGAGTRLHHRQLLTAYVGKSTGFKSQFDSMTCVIPSVKLSHVRVLLMACLFLLVLLFIATIYCVYPCAETLWSSHIEGRIFARSAKYGLIR